MRRRKEERMEAWKVEMMRVEKWMEKKKVDCAADPPSENLGAAKRKTGGRKLAARSVQ